MLPGEWQRYQVRRNDDDLIAPFAVEPDEIVTRSWGSSLPSYVHDLLVEADGDGARMDLPAAAEQIAEPHTATTWLPQPAPATANRSPLVLAARLLAGELLTALPDGSR